jgi:calcineurin-like phosphoesterase family protein
MMPDAFVLRFRDFEQAETVLSHEQVIAARGAVWWGWWKKDSEHGIAGGLARIVDRCPMEIGLLNRVRGTQFIAVCEQIVFSEDGSPIGSPDASATPSYYRSGHFPAWFLLTSIRSVATPEWIDRFGAIPGGEPTAFFIPDSRNGHAPDGENIKSGSAIQSASCGEPVRLAASGILHLSDLHFGSDYGFPLKTGGVPHREALDDQIIRGLRDSRCEKIGLVVVSGDITTRGEHEGFLEAQRFMGRLLDRLGLTTHHLVVAPGNHDILLEDPHVTRTYHVDQLYRDFINLLYRADSLELNRLQWFELPDERDLFVLTLNSVRPRRPETMQYGYVGRDLYGPLVEEMAGIRASLVAQGKRQPLAVAVLHHHVLPPPLVEDPEESRPVSLTLDAGQLIEDLQRAGFHFILHGHQHIPFVKSVSQALRSGSGAWYMPPLIHIIGNGSSGAMVHRLWNQMRNNCVGVYFARDTHLQVTMYEYADRVPFNRYLSLQLGSPARVPST